MSIYRLVLTTVAKKADAERIAVHFIKKKLAACVNQIGPVRSYYTWKGKFCRDSEYLLLIKTKQDLVKELERELGRLHPYEIPEVIVVPLTGGSKKYLRWLGQVLKS